MKNNYYEFLELINSMYEKFLNNYYKSETYKTHFYKMTEDDSKYLMYIYKKGKVKSVDFAKDMRITKSAVSQTITKFVSKGYVKKEESEIDKRVQYISLTDEIKSIFKLSIDELNEQYENALTFLSDEEITQLMTLLYKINERI